MKKERLKTNFRDASFAVQWSSPYLEVERPSYKVGFDVYCKNRVLSSTYYPLQKESILRPLACKVIMNPDLARTKKTVKTSKKSVKDKIVIS
jgi:hypothetical protein